jgi:hypothetical protein
MKIAACAARRATVNAVAATCAAMFSIAAPAADPPEPPPWLLDHIGAIQALWQRAPNAGDVRFVVGNDLWQPGLQYRNGSQWLAMVCEHAGCALEPATLKTRSEQWQGHYDDQPTKGQQLNFQLSNTSRGEVVAWFLPNVARPWLKAGAIPTYAFGPRQDGPGTLEAEVHLPSGERALLVPLMLQDEHGTGQGFLQLRAGGQRQMLLGTLGDCGGKPDPARYLLWAGDLDKDGRADYLVSFVDADGPTHLYLSGDARRGQVVSVAGIYLAPPYGGECDGGPWLQR